LKKSNVTRGIGERRNNSSTSQNENLEGSQTGSKSRKREMEAINRPRSLKAPESYMSIDRVQYWPLANRSLQTPPIQLVSKQSRIINQVPWTSGILEVKKWSGQGKFEIYYKLNSAGDMVSATTNLTSQLTFKLFQTK
jgi:hypothetical protein